MDRSQILTKMKAAIVDQLGVDEDKITEQASLAQDLGADSLDLLQLVTALEDEFSISIPDEDFEHLVTVGDAIDEVLKLA
ncbi:MAG: acyl carrier protein [Coriobacteriales bacterium]|nr:acyl carrier protein [Coriobacteriales bacterium]